MKRFLYDIGLGLSILMALLIIFTGIGYYLLYANFPEGIPSLIPWIPWLFLPQELYPEEYQGNLGFVLSWFVFIALIFVWLGCLFLVFKMGKRLIR